MVNEQIVCMWH